MRKDAVTPEVRALVLLRDSKCFCFRLDPLHECRDKWGFPHSPYEFGALTVDHVHGGYGMMGRRAPSDPAHLVAMCWQGNVGVPSKEVRQAERAYLASVS